MHARRARDSRIKLASLLHLSTTANAGLGHGNA
jgi:hypothetical protein